MNEFNAQEIIEKHDGKCKTRNGREVTQLTLLVASDELYSLVGVMEGVVESWMVNGKWVDTDKDDRHDLIMPRTVVAEWWIPISLKHQHTGFGYKNYALTSIIATSYPCKNPKSIHITLYGDDTVESEVVK